MYAMDFAQVGANIQKWLDKKGVTQQALADALGISKQVMNKIIKGSKAINVNELAKIATCTVQKSEQRSCQHDQCNVKH